MRNRYFKVVVIKFRVSQTRPHLVFVHIQMAKPSVGYKLASKTGHAHLKQLPVYVHYTMFLVCSSAPEEKFFTGHLQLLLGVVLMFM